LLLHPAGDTTMVLAATGALSTTPPPPQLSQQPQPLSVADRDCRAAHVAHRTGRRTAPR